MAAGRGRVPAEESMRAPSPRARSPRLPARRALAGAAFLLLLVVGAPRPAFAEEPWEKAIREAVVEQDKELARMSPKALINRYAGRLQREPNDLPTLYVLARAYGKAKSHDDAITTYGEVLKLEPRLWYAWRDRGALRWEKKDVAGAEADLRQAIAVKPEFPIALQDLATILLHQQAGSGGKGGEEAARLLNKVLELEPGNEKARFQLVNVYLALKRPDDGLRELQVLLSREPNNAGLRLKRAELLAAKGRYEEAFAEFKRLAVEKPSAQEPLWGWLRTAQQAGSSPEEEALWVLERLARLVSESDRKKLLEQVASIRKRQSQPRPDEPAGPPKPEQIAAAVRSSDEKVRREVLAWLVTRPVGYQWPPVLTQALIERAVRGDEPVPQNRALALDILGRTGVVGLAPLLRWGLYDADPLVRAKAADVLGDLGAPASLGALYDSAVGDPGIKDAAAREVVAVAAQAAAYRVAKVPPPLSEESLSARVQAFRAWWRDPATRPKKLEAIENVLKAEESRPWYVLRPFVDDEDPYIWTRTYYAFKKVASHATGSSPLEAWLRALPVHDDKTLLPENRATVVREMLAWWAKKPA
jgi:tetratricopeptide (TPR) repeat protein